MEKRTPVFFFAPFVSSTMRVEPAWIDYNGHMNMAYYHVLFDRAVEEGFSLVGLGHDYLENARPRSSQRKSTPSTTRVEAA
jgi:acyl-CoA thioester hydrolase